MKGTLFQKPAEFRISTQGESWCQGDSIPGSLTIKNHGNAPLVLEGIRVLVAYANLKKAHQKQPGAFQELISASIEGAPSTLDPLSETTLSWKITTDRNFPVTDHLSSPFLLYGKGDALEQLGHLQLQIHPFALVQDFLNAIQTQFRFVVKSKKSSKGRVEVKLTPPDSKSFALLEQLTLSFLMDGDDIEARYQFQLKKIDSNAGIFDMTKTKKDQTQRLSPADYRLPSGRVHLERIEEALREALSAVESKIAF